MTVPTQITVGVDGSAPSLTAVDHAIAMATRRAAPLLLVHAYQSPLYDYPTFTYTGESTESVIRAHAEKTLHTLVERLRAEHPDLDIRGRQVNGAAAGVLIDESAKSAVTVLGSRGRGGFAGLILGSVSTQVAGHAHGPVVVVHDRDGERTEQAPVVVGYDGSAGAEAALFFAAGEARSRGVELEVLCLHFPGLDDDRAHAQEAVAAAARRLADIHPGLKVEAHAMPGMDPAFRLITRSRTAALTVVGSRGHGGFVGMLLGSVGRSVLHHAYGPVAIVHSPTSDEARP